ncbi:MAG: hypothetical protein ACOCWQ_01880 [Nanoarchaeota archaeon]
MAKEKDDKPKTLGDLLQKIAGAKKSEVGDAFKNYDTFSDKIIPDFVEDSLVPMHHDIYQTAKGHIDEVGRDTKIADHGEDKHIELVNKIILSYLDKHTGGDFPKDSLKKDPKKRRKQLEAAYKHHMGGDVERLFDPRQGQQSLLDLYEIDRSDPTKTYRDMLVDVRASLQQHVDLHGQRMRSAAIQHFFTEHHQSRNMAKYLQPKVEEKYVVDDEVMFKHLGLSDHIGIYESLKNQSPLSREGMHKYGLKPMKKEKKKKS